MEGLMMCALVNVSHEEWIGKTSRASCRVMHRAALKCTATLRSRILTRVSSNSFRLGPHNQLKKSPKLSNLRESIPPTGQERHCHKVIPDFRSLQKHMDSDKHLLKLERETAYDSIKRKWVEIPYVL